jgi:glutamate-5-semialdehyde dehydrogenase
MDETLEHIAAYGSPHTEAIITKNHGRDMCVLSALDSSVVLTTAFTRLNDGGQLGLSAEIGISTNKLPAFRSMGLTELSTTKFIVFSERQVRV